MNKRTVTEVERNNKTAMYCHMIEALILAFFYVIQWLEGRRTVIYTLAVLVLALGPVVAETAAWRKDHETTAIKHLIGYGFALTYTWILFTATVEYQLTFLYVIPMLLVIQIFNDVSYSVKITVGVVIENLIAVVGGAMTGAFGFRDITAGTMQVVVMTLIAVYAYQTAKTTARNNQDKLDEAREANEKTEQVLGSVSQNSEQMSAGIDEIHQRVEQLKSASHTTKNAMEGVTAGAAETAEAVQRQMEQTETIGSKVTQVDAAVSGILDRMQQTLDVLAEGTKDMEALVEEVDLAVRNSVDTAEKMETLNQYITEMNSIVELIGGITSQTSLLALNASIEAARAGEAGRGFAVVATEISALATQTKEATAHITSLIGNVSNSIAQMVTVIRGMIGGINQQKDSTERTAQSLGTIREHTYAIRDNVEHLTRGVEELKTANQEIADSVQTISAVSQEVSAHANETLEAEEENMRNLLLIAEKSQELRELSMREA